LSFLESAGTCANASQVPCKNNVGCCPKGVTCLPNGCDIPCTSKDIPCGSGCCYSYEVCTSTFKCAPGSGSGSSSRGGSSGSGSGGISNDAFKTHMQLSIELLTTIVVLIYISGYM